MVEVPIILLGACLIGSALGYAIVWALDWYVGHGDE